MALTVRLDPKLDRVLNALAKSRGLSRSDVVREALEQYGTQDAASATAHGGPYDAWADVLGIVSIGVRDPSRTTGAQVAEMLRTQAAAPPARDAKATPPARRRHAWRPR